MRLIFVTVALFGGIHVSKPSYKILDLLTAMEVDTTSRIINGIWDQYITPWINYATCIHTGNCTNQLMNRKWISAGSVRAYRSDHMNADLTDNDNFTNALADLIADDPGQIASLIGQLPAEWYPTPNPHSPGLHQHIPLTPNPNRTLPVCDCGKN